MNNFFFAIIAACAFTSSLLADGWQDKWSEAVILLEKGDGNLRDALIPLNEAILLLEKDNGKSLPHLYVDRARLNLFLHDNQEALDDAEKALKRDVLDLKGKERAIVTKLIANVRLGHLFCAEKDLKAFIKNSNLPFVDIDNSKVIIRNVPENDYYKKMMTCYLIHCGFCYDLEAFQFLKSGILIAESHCGCEKCLAEYAKTRECEACLSLINPTKTNISLEGLVLAAVSYLANEIVQLDDQVAFLKAICHMQNIKSSLEVFDDTFANILKDSKKSVPCWD